MIISPRDVTKLFQVGQSSIHDTVGREGRGRGEEREGGGRGQGRREEERFLKRWGWADMIS